VLAVRQVPCRGTTCAQMRVVSTVSYGPAAGGAPMGVIVPEAPALRPATRPRGAQRRAADPVAQHQNAAASTRPLHTGAARGGELRTALRGRIECACALPLLRDRRGICGWRGREAQFAGPAARSPDCCTSRACRTLLQCSSPTSKPDNGPPRKTPSRRREATFQPHDRLFT
jgi:hypothetical protein